MGEAEALGSPEQLSSVLCSNHKVWLILLPSCLQDGVEQLIHTLGEEMGH